MARRAPAVLTLPLAPVGRVVVHQRAADPPEGGRGAAAAGPARAAGINHACVAMDNFDSAAVTKLLVSYGLKQQEGQGVRRLSPTSRCECRIAVARGWDSRAVFHRSGRSRHPDSGRKVLRRRRPARRALPTADAGMMPASE